MNKPIRMMLLSIVLTLAWVTSPAAADKPNILVIWGDDIGQSNISAYTFGLVGYRTPNIDRIAKEGMGNSPVRPGDRRLSWVKVCFELVSRRSDFQVLS